MNAPAHIVVVDDDSAIRDTLQAYLNQEGYGVSTAKDGESLRRVMAERPIDLAVLDLILPDEDGLSLTRYLRGHYDVGVIILTGKGETVDRIIGLEVGADDYVAKPFELRELLARIKSVLRRTKGSRTRRSRAETHSLVRFAGWELDLSSRELRSSQGQEVALTTGEFDLLVAFVNHRNRVLSRDKLLALTRKRPAAPFDRSVDVQVGRLRRKIEVDPDHPALIKTVRGAGYIFTPIVERR